MLTEDGAVGRALRELAPPERLDAGVEAAGLARRLEFLTWPDRADALDQFLWRQARSRLRHELITAVVNRRRGPGAAEVELFAAYCRAVVTATLAALDEPARVGGEAAAAAALTHRFSLLGPDRRAAEAWLDAGAGRRESAARELARLPGYAFLLLAMSPDDSAESFAARDAFFAAMHGRAPG